MRIYSQKYSRKIISFIIILLIEIQFIGIKQAECQQIEFKEKNVLKLTKKASKLFEKKKYEEALEILSQAEREAQVRQDKVSIADIISGAGYLLYQDRNLESSLLYFETVLDINKRLDNKQGLVNNYSFIAIITTDQGNYIKGIELFQKALSIQEDINDEAGIAQNLNNLATFTSYLGDYEKAIELLNQALNISEGINNPILKARTLIHLGTLNLRLRNYQESIAYLDAAYKTASTTEVRDIKSKEMIESGDVFGPQETYGRDMKSKDIIKELRTLEAKALTVGGVVYRHQGDYEKALDNYKRALKINEKLKNKSETAVNLSVIGELYKETGHYNEATKFIEKSLEISRKNKDQVMIGVNLNYLGEIKYEQKDYSGALELYQEALEIFERLGFKDRIARVLIDISYLELKMKDREGAIENFNKAITIYKGLGDREWIRVALFGKAVALEEKGSLAQAETTYKEVVDIFESIRQDVAGGEEAEQIFSDVNVKIYEKLVSLLITLGKKEEALEYIERSKSKTLRDTLLKSGITSFEEKTRGIIRQYDKLSARDASINYELARERSKPSPVPKKIDNLIRTLANTREEFNQVTFKLLTQYPEIYNLLAITPQTFSSLRQGGYLPNNFTLIEYFVTENETFIFIASQSGLTIESVSISKDELNMLVANFRELIHASRSIPTSNWRDMGGVEYSKYVRPLKEVSIRLYNYLIKPIKEEIQVSETVGIIPFGSLNYLPFQALAEEGKGGGLEFFLEQKNVVYLTNTNYLNIILNTNRGRAIKSIIAFGNPDLGKFELALPHAMKEVITIKKIFPNTLVFTERDATKENLKNNWGKHQIIHLAAHGILSEKGPSILLAPPDSGSVTTRDITGLPPIENTKLVALSACETAIDLDQKNPTGTQLASIALAFTWVGVPSVIATLWNIDDEATSNLMEAFYNNLRDGGMIYKYKAFTNAQISMVKREDKYGQPYYWAPFILYGAWD